MSPGTRTVKNAASNEGRAFPAARPERAVRGRSFEAEFTVRFPAMIDLAIERFAARFGVSKAEVVRRAVMFALFVKPDEFVEHAFEGGEGA